jgi:hypothetical protein
VAQKEPPTPRTSSTPPWTPELVAALDAALVKLKVFIYSGTAPHVPTPEKRAAHLRELAQAIDDELAVRGIDLQPFGADQLDEADARRDERRALAATLEQLRLDACDEFTAAAIPGGHTPADEFVAIQGRHLDELQLRLLRGER